MKNAYIRNTYAKNTYIKDIYIKNTYIKGILAYIISICINNFSIIKRLEIYLSLSQILGIKPFKIE